MRHDKARALVELARRLAGSAEGLTLDEMAAAAGVDRRTAERMRDRLWDLFPQMEAVPDPPTKRFRIPAGLDGFLQAHLVIHDEDCACFAALEEGREQPVVAADKRCGRRDRIALKLRVH